MKIVSTRPTITRRELEGVLDCLINDELTTGEAVKNFEQETANLLGIRHALAVNSVTAAYHLVFQALEINADSEVIIPSFFHQAPLNSLRITGGKAVLVDNEENSLFPSIDDIKSKITEKTRAIVLGHMFGYHFDISALADISVPVIEDISHAVGSELNEEQVGRKGAFTVLSFAPDMIITTGTGGMVLTSNSRAYGSMKDMRGVRNDMTSFEYTMTDFQGAMGLSQIQKISGLLKRRREIARIYHEAVRLTPHKSLFPYSDNFAYQTFPVLFDATAEKVSKYWKKNGIEVVPALEYPLHMITGEKGFDYPNSDRLARKLFMLPLYPTLSRKEIEKISKLAAGFI